MYYYVVQPCLIKKKRFEKAKMSIKMRCLIPIDAVLHLESCDRNSSLSSGIL